MAPAKTMEGFFLGESFQANKKLSEMFLQLHINEKSGRGVPKIRDSGNNLLYHLVLYSLV